MGRIQSRSVVNSAARVVSRGYERSRHISVFYFILWPTNAQLFHKFSHSRIFRHYRVILRQLVINTLPSYTSISNAAVGNTIYN